MKKRYAVVTWDDEPQVLTRHRTFAKALKRRRKMTDQGREVLVQQITKTRKTKKR